MTLVTLPLVEPKFLHLQRDGAHISPLHKVIGRRRRFSSYLAITISCPEGWKPEGALKKVPLTPHCQIYALCGIHSTLCEGKKMGEHLSGSLPDLSVLPGTVKEQAGRPACLLRLAHLQKHSKLCVCSHL